jgi:CRT-like, chloroquine-resistance transporter-like
MLLFFPMMMMIQRNFQFGDLPGYFCAGAQALSGVSASGWDAAAPLMFIAANLLFNMIAVTALRSVGAATMAIVMTAAVPATAFAFTMNLPVLGAGGPLSRSYLPGLGVVLLGMLLYNAKVLFSGISSSTEMSGQTA